jgi:UDP-N-acetylglucosamine 2-epimerase (non-hydrolysing)
MQVSENKGESSILKNQDSWDKTPRSDLPKGREKEHRKTPMKTAIIVGTRPEIIKMSPIIHECERLNLEYILVHTGQHYSYEMDRVFFEQLELPEPDYNLNVGSGSHAEQTSKILVRTEQVLQKEMPDVAVVEGDTNTVLAGALAAAKLHIKVGHVEAGLRSYDRMMPEEINRVLTDHCADVLFAPTEQAQQILRGEGIPAKQIYVTGNTIVDAVVHNIKLAEQHAHVFENLGLKKHEYFLATLHRQENVDDCKRFQGILKGLSEVNKKYDLPVVYPVHPRSSKKIQEFGLDAPGVTLVEPLDFLDFLQLEQNARVVLTDSGGVQEEACILGTPCVTLRTNTERPETLSVGSNVLAGTYPKNILECTSVMYLKKNGWENPFGDGASAKRIMQILRDVV